MQCVYCKHWPARDVIDARYALREGDVKGFVNFLEALMDRKSVASFEVRLSKNVLQQYPISKMNYVVEVGGILSKVFNEVREYCDDVRNSF